MGSSWGHAIEAVTEEQRDFYARQGWTCASGKCQAEPTHHTVYEYVTGRAGRTSVAKRRACPGHTACFAAQHDLPFIGGALSRSLEIEISTAGAGLERAEKVDIHDHNRVIESHAYLKAAMRGLLDALAAIPAAGGEAR